MGIYFAKKLNLNTFLSNTLEQDLWKEKCYHNILPFARLPYLPLTNILSQLTLVLAEFFISLPLLPTLYCHLPLPISELSSNLSY
jgi:hypothetical protein